MTKVSKKKKQSPKRESIKRTPAINKHILPEKIQDIIFPVLMALFLLILLKPLVVDKLSPQGVDVTASIGINHQVQEYTKKTGESALWNPNVFSGMPRYHRFNARAWSFDNLFSLLSKNFSSIFIYYLFGSLGLYLLLRYMKLSPLVCFIGAMAFILMPHYKSLYIVGHYTKFRAIMYLPWIYLTFSYFLHKRNLLSAALFALSFGLQIRTQHYQIIFYTGIMIFAIGVYPLIRDLLDKKYSLFARSSFMVLAAVILAILSASQPLFQAKEYLPYSKRGKTTIAVTDQEKTTEKTDGVSMEYATSWSTHPAEIMTWLVPRFYGGMSTEKYKGDLIPQARNRAIQIPGYWGYMPFTQSYEYMGVVLLIFAVLGFLANRKKPAFIAAFVFLLFLVFLSFGKHFESFYSLFYHYFPFFNKFRAPMMSVVVSYFIIILFAFSGFKYLKEVKSNVFSWDRYRNITYTLAAFFALGIIFVIYGQFATFISASEESGLAQIISKSSGGSYSKQAMEFFQQIEVFRKVRADFFSKDVVRYLLLVALTAGIILGYLKRKLNFTMTSVFLGLIIIGDHLSIQNRVEQDLTNVKKLEKRHFRETATNKFIQKDKEIFRVLPYDNDLFKNNRWAYYHQSIGGYTPIKMYTIEELVEKNIYNGWDARLPINWNVMKILNVKYLISKRRIPSEYLELVHIDRATGLNTYLYEERLPRAYFVSDIKVIPDEIERLKTINSREFDPAKTAIIETSLEGTIDKPDSMKTSLISFNPNQVVFDVFTDKQALLVLSEVYYPPGWKIFVDDHQIEEIYRTNHAVQSIVVPAGEHRVELKFEPDSYYKYLKISYASLGILYLVIIGSLVSMYLKKKQAR